ncbi:brain and acute leukemia cytoplasmic protein isoform X2 [Mirounga angustirostris]|uniref:brain and acute leukemia cytoplasmic protein isoform X2 n=1 Tax=Mirounga angustirostris TaxID=9716 RepID=UPI00313D3376
MAVEEPCRSAISSWSLLSPGARHTSEPSGGSSPTHHLTTEGTLRENPQVYEVGEVREARWPAPELESSRRLQQLCDLSPDPSPCRSSIFHTIASNCHVQDSRAILCFFPQGVLEDGLSSTGVPRSTAPGGISNPDKKMSCGTQCPNPQSLSSGPLTQKQNGLRTTEAKRDAKRMSAKEVTINVTDSIRQVDRNRRMAKNCVN